MLLYMVFASFFGSAGYTLSLLFFSPLLVSSSFLLEPIIAQVLGYLMGLDQIPGVMTALGSFFAIYGIWYIDCGARERTMMNIKTSQIEFTGTYNSLNSSAPALNSSITNLNSSHLSGR